MHLRRALIGSERWGEKMRSRIADERGERLYGIYGLTEVYGPGIAISCECGRGMHYWDEGRLRALRGRGPALQRAAA